jgi:hypothetical protein
MTTKNHFFGSLKSKIKQLKKRSHVRNIVKGIPDTENSTFTSDSRLFVTGGKGIYEIKSTGGKDKPIQLLKGPNCTGIVEHKAYLYATCIDLKMNPKKLFKTTGFKPLNFFSRKYWLTNLTEISGERQLLAAKVKGVAKPKFQKVKVLKDMFIPNGLGVDQSGNLFSADETFVGGGKIVKIKISASDPMKVSTPEVWADKGVDSPNGIIVHGPDLYFTDGGTVKKANIMNSGAVGKITQLYSRKTIFDDLTVVEDKEYGVVIIVTDFIKGSIFSLNPKTNKIIKETRAVTFAGPSSVNQGEPPISSPAEIVVTEKGFLGETKTKVGNRVSAIALKHLGL